MEWLRQRSGGRTAGASLGTGSCHQPNTTTVSSPVHFCPQCTVCIVYISYPVHSVHSAFLPSVYGAIFLVYTVHFYSVCSEFLPGAQNTVMNLNRVHSGCRPNRKPCTLQVLKAMQCTSSVSTSVQSLLSSWTPFKRT